MIKPVIISFCFLLAAGFLRAQTAYYYPPNSTDEWVQTSPALLGWDADYLDTLYQFLEENNTKGFIILHKGQMVAEKYFGSFTKDSVWYWASAGKSLTAFLIGIAQQESYLSINDSTVDYLGEGWTSCSAVEEAKITIRHQLTMTTGLNTTAVNLDCTLPECLKCSYAPGERWFYHNAPYTLLEKVIENATGQSVNAWTNAKLRNTIGLQGFWLKLDYNNVRFGTTRDMARFGLLALSRGKWNGNDILKDTAYFNQMISSSQNLNPAYGYLWWLNGKENYIPPGFAASFSGSLIPSAPADMFAALGKNDQKIYVVPSLDLVVVRCGNAADDVLFALSTFDDDLWKHLQKFINPVVALENQTAFSTLRIFPNPVNNMLHWHNKNGNMAHFSIYNIAGKRLMQGNTKGSINCSGLATGVYLLQLSSDETHRQLFIKH